MFSSLRVLRKTKLIDIHSNVFKSQRRLISNSTNLNDGLKSIPKQKIDLLSEYGNDCD